MRLACTKPVLVAGHFTSRGMQHLSAADVNSRLNRGRPECYWSMMTGIAAPLAAALSGADAGTVARRASLVASMNSRHPDGCIDACSEVIVGAKWGSAVGTLHMNCSAAAGSWGALGAGLVWCHAPVEPTPKRDGSHFTMGLVVFDPKSRG